jgi:hypothetical protein
MNEFDPSRLILIGVALATMFFGYFFGLREGRGQGYKRRQREEAEQEKQELLTRAAQPAAAPEPPTAGTPKITADDPGLLRVKEEAGSLRLELDGIRLNPEILTPLQRKRLIEVITGMRPWIEARAAAAPPPSATAPAAPAAPPAAVPAAPAASAPPPAPAPIAPAIPAVPAATPVEPAPPAARSMVSQIDEILQKNIAGTALATRGIRLMDAPGGGVAVFIGLERYSSIGDVTDPEIQAALRTAVATWEKKYTPGL